MYFSFTQLSELMESSVEKMKGLSSWSQLSSMGARFSSAVAGVARSYAQTYALVQQSQYDKDGNIKDVTSEERVTVPDNILASTRAALRQLSVDMESLVRPSNVEVVASASTSSLKQTLSQFTLLVSSSNNFLIRVDLEAKKAYVSAGAKVATGGSISLPPAVSFALFGAGGTMWTATDFKVVSGKLISYQPVKGVGIAVAAFHYKSGQYGGTEVIQIYGYDDNIYRIPLASSPNSSISAEAVPEEIDLVIAGEYTSAIPLTPLQPYDSHVELSSILGAETLALPVVSAVGSATITIDTNSVFDAVLKTIPVEEAIQALTPQ